VRILIAADKTKPLKNASGPLPHKISLAHNLFEGVMIPALLLVR
jgi:hypothetical protein